VTRRLSLLFLILLPAVAEAQIAEITPFVGYQAGGAIELDEEDNPIDGSLVFGAVGSFDRGRGRMLDLLVSHQTTGASRQDPFEPLVSADVSVTYFHIGGRYYWDPERRYAPYVAATGGGTYMTVDNADGLFLSFSLGGGIDVPLSRRVALRFDGRFYTTLIGNSVELSCTDSGQFCSGITQGQNFNQFTASTGLVIRF
jgi:hypothetical protein